MVFAPALIFGVALLWLWSSLSQHMWCEQLVPTSNNTSFFSFVPHHECYLTRLREEISTIPWQSILRYGT